MYPSADTQNVEWLATIVWSYCINKRKQVKCKLFLESFPASAFIIVLDVLFCEKRGEYPSDKRI